MNFDDFINQIDEDIMKQKSELDMRVFLWHLKEELERKGIELTVERCTVPIMGSDVVGVKLDLFEHDKKKDAEIEKYKKTIECANCEKDKAACEYQNEIDQLKSRVVELEQSQEDLPIEPIEIVKYLIDRTIEVKNTFPALQGGETSHVPLHDVSELRQIAEHILVYCKYHSEEEE